MLCCQLRAQTEPATRNHKISHEHPKFRKNLLIFTSYFLTLQLLVQVESWSDIDWIRTQLVT